MLHVNEAEFRAPDDDFGFSVDLLSAVRTPRFGLRFYLKWPPEPPNLLSMASGDQDQKPKEELKTETQKTQETDIASFNTDSFGRVSRLSKLELVTLIATAAVPGVAHGACACGY